jgi:predicted AAA+ superfamily ATPase
MRRSGKSSFLWQCLDDRIKAGAPRESQVLLNFEDERIEGITAVDLGWLLEEYFKLYPGLRDKVKVALYLDEIHLVPGWEKFVRRILDSGEKIEIFLSGSSAKMLSTELSSSMRGRALDVVVMPFSFREVLRFYNMEPNDVWIKLKKSFRSEISNKLLSYIKEGGFPETIGLPLKERYNLLQSYIDVTVLRDIIERHKISNPMALRAMIRHLLSNAASYFSIHKFYNTLRSQGFSVGKDTLHDYLAHIEDAFLIRTLSIHTSSERQKMVNPRKIYPIDSGIIPLYDRSGKINQGHALENVVLIEMERRGYDVSYVKTEEGYEVDFIANEPEKRPILIQVCSDFTEDNYNREIRALIAASKEIPDATPTLLTLDTLPSGVMLPDNISWISAEDWLLNR